MRSSYQAAVARGALAVGLAVSFNSAAQAQVAAPASADPVVTTAPVSCQVVDAAPTAGRASLYAVCAGHGAPIGPADQYSVSTSTGGSVTVVLKMSGRTHIWLASPAAGGGVLLEEMTRDLARAAGRAGDLGLGDATVDASRFAVDGTVAVTSKAGSKQLDLLGRAAAVPVAAPVATATTDN